MGAAKLAGCGVHGPWDGAVDFTRKPLRDGARRPLLVPRDVMSRPRHNGTESVPGRTETLADVRSRFVIGNVSPEVSMIRRTLQGGLLAAVALFALVPTAAVAAVGDRAAPAPAVATVQHHPHTLLPVSVRHTPVRYSAHRFWRCHHHARHFCHYRHHRHTNLVTRTAYHRRCAGRVATHHVRLNVRSGPGLGYRIVGHRHVQGRLMVVCRTHGSYVHGNRHWYRLADGSGYVSAHYVRTRGAVLWC